MRTLVRFSSALLLATATAFAMPACATGGDEDDLLEELDAEASAKASFDVWQNEGGAWFFHMTASNGQTLLSSEAYENRVGALSGLLSVLDNGGLTSRYTTKKGTDGKYYVSLKAANGATIATAQGYKSKSNATRAITAMTRSVGGYLEAQAARTGARIETFADAAGQFRFSVYAANGQRVLASEGYVNEALALNGAMAVTENAAARAQYNVLPSSGGAGYYFTLEGGNGEIIGVSEVYSTKAAADRAVNALITLAPNLAAL
ncbi:MAG: YegP family protein [Kofleriaceae bacterium]|nr:YegP family protein [Kofleriaceae bacterium]MBP6839733.1 YegP family protein [Kofleriaceae bacterium]